VILRNSETGEIIADQLHHGGPVSSVAFSNDSRIVASAGHDRSIVLWNVDTMKRLREISSPESVTTIAFHPNESKLAYATLTGNVGFFDIVKETNIYPAFKGDGSKILSIAFSANRSAIAAGTWVGNVLLWDVDRREQPAFRFKGHRDAVLSVAFAPDSRLLASASNDGRVGLWDAPKGKPLLEPVQGYQGGLTSVAVSADGKTLALGSTDGTIALWSTELASPLALGCSIVNRNLSQVEWFELVGIDVPYEAVCSPKATATTLETLPDRIFRTLAK
jgi:WD40 repeat protein